ncbi:hypothetical protein [Nitrosomonas ureae]|uniref:hypothetical protein n=1 Tax=Nitrosomonas ureae TaxID=44577 RepID=UPI0011AB3376|nr:hypothetical protein [Nitrosomonas ureae]
MNYRIVTPDFNDEGTLEEIGQIKIDRILHTYEFTPTNIWINYHFIPPWVFGRSIDEQQQLLDTKFKGYEAGGWTASIHRRVIEMIENNRFPQ